MSKLMSFLRHAIKPDWQQRKCMMRFEAWAFLLLAYVVVAASRLPQPAVVQRSGISDLLDFISFNVHVFYFHLGVVVAVVTVFCAIFRWWKLFVLSLPLLVFLTGGEAIALLPKSLSVEGASDFKLLTCNVLYVNKRNVELIQKILDQQPDLVCVQELTPDWDAKLRSALASGYPHQSTIPQTDAFGIGVYSRFPFAGEPSTPIPDRQDMVPQQRVSLLISGTTVTLYNIHLYPPGGLQTYSEQKWQVRHLAAAVRMERGPLVMCGDFNLPERTRQAAELERAGVQDAYSIAGFGRGSTWPAVAPHSYLPGLRLDHIYINRHIACTGIRVVNAPGSDHRMVVGSFRLK
jgi:endonuclease/exonuclease/phosphatase (EEP) superfamily protein YafD